LDNTLNYIPKLIRAALNEDHNKIEKISISLSRKLKKDYPEISEQIGEILSANKVGANTIRSLNLEPKPIDKDSRLDLVDVDSIGLIDRPILNNKVNIEIDNFIKERKMKDKLLKKGIEPTKSILLTGPPGVGKTYLANYLAGVLDLNLVSLNLATTISSYLGKTGKNIKNILDYSRKNSSILFLDEFDAIAKKRDDESDLGELKRIVNVLLKELDNWPSYSIIIAATNHPQILDKAIWRRFDLILDLDLPNDELKKQLLRKYLPEDISDDNIDIIATFLNKISPADIEKFSQKIKRKSIINETPSLEIALNEIPNFIDVNSNEIGELCRFAKKTFGNKITIREIANLVGKTPSTVHYHLNKEE